MLLLDPLIHHDPLQDAASPRYIFTALQKAARAVFHPDDDALLTYLDDDGLSIEPEFYMPIIPLILVNGSDGIGTGWSSNVRYDRWPSSCFLDSVPLGVALVGGAVS